MLENIVKLYGIDPVTVEKINDGFQNQVYLCSDGTREYVLRLSDVKRRTIKEIEGELAFLSELGKRDIAVSLPILSSNGKKIERIDNWLAVLFDKASGIAVQVTDPFVWNKELFFQWGKVIGQLHQAAIEMNFKVERKSWNKADSDVLGLLPKLPTGTIKERYENLLRRLESYHPESALFGLIHNDLHQGNFLVQNGNITLFDFDDCAYHWFAYDLAVSYYHAYWQSSSFTPEHTEFSEKFWHYFLDGYKSERRLKKELLEQIPIFLKIREIFLYLLFLEKWDPNYLEEWQEYTLIDLKERIEGNVPYSPFDFSKLMAN